jgi:hypothetical protein
MFELFNDIYFIVYKLYYVGQNDNLGIRVSLNNWNRWSSLNRLRVCEFCGATILWETSLLFLLIKSRVVSFETCVTS